MFNASDLRPITPPPAHDWHTPSLKKEVKRLASEIERANDERTSLVSDVDRLRNASLSESLGASAKLSDRLDAALVREGELREELGEFYEAEREVASKVRAERRAAAVKIEAAKKKELIDAGYPEAAFVSMHFHLAHADCQAARAAVAEVENGDYAAEENRQLLAVLSQRCQARRDRRLTL